MANFYTDNEQLKLHLSHPLMEKIARLKENDYIDKDNYDYAPMDYEDAFDNYDKVLEIIGEISGNIIAENAELVDHDGPQLVNNEVIYAKGTQQNIDTITEAGLFGISLPRSYGGLNFPIVPYAIAAEVVSRADAGFANIWGLQDCAETIHEFASEDIKNEFLPRICKGETAAMDLTEPDAGSDLQAVQLKATLNEADGKWYLNGVKRFITNGDAHISLVLARSEEGTSDGRGLSLFVYDRKDKALTIRRIENKLGIKGSPTCELVFSNAPALLVGDRKLGLIKYVMSLMNSARLGVGAQSVGIAEAAYREALKYAHEREQFGKPIIKYPAVFEMLTDMRVKTDAIRCLLYETARHVDMYKAYANVQEHRALTPEEKLDNKKYQKSSDVMTPLTKLFSSEYCNQIAYDGLQIHGGTGFMKDFAIERIYRDARITSIYEGTSQLQVIAAIKGVVNGQYLLMIREYEQTPVKPEFEFQQKLLVKMTQQFEKVFNRINEQKDSEYLDFHARRLVEMAGNIICGYLLVIDANRNDILKRSAEIFIRKVRAENIAKTSFINNCEVRDISSYKV